MKSKKTEFKPDKPKRNLLAVILTIIGIAIAIALLFLGLSKAFATETYYILNQNVPARVRVTDEMLQEMEVSEGGAPPNAITRQQVINQPIYTKLPLIAGDILTQSNTGFTLDTSTGVPDEWVVTSLNISGSQAAGGQIKRGDYFDILGVTDKGSRYILTDVLALDVKYTASENDESEGNGNKMNEEIQYIIGVPQDVAAMLAHATDSKQFRNLRIVLSPKSVEYKERELEDIAGVISSGNQTEPIDVFEGTDPTFTAVLRDKNGRPVNREYCEADLVEPAELCDELPGLEKEKEENENERAKSSQTVTPEGENYEQTPEEEKEKNDEKNDKNKEEKEEVNLIESEDK